MLKIRQKFDMSAAMRDFAKKARDLCARTENSMRLVEHNAEIIFLGRIQSKTIQRGIHDG